MHDERNYWFPAKRRGFGWGWGPPRTWQGWAVLVGFLLLLGLDVLIFPPDTHHAAFVLCALGLTALLLLICWIKGEPLGGD